MAFEALKERQAFVWGNGRFEFVSETAADVHDGVVEALAPHAGETWLDVACGTGAVAARAAAAGATVTGIDLAPALIETAKRRASEAGLEIDYRVGDAENLDLPDATFDVVSSTFGVIFAPDQPRAASELVRVTRPGGRLGLATWTPDGGIGRMVKMTSQFQPPPPEGAGDPMEWGREEHIRALLGDAFDLRFERRVSTFTTPSAEDYWQLMVANFGPVKTLVESMDEERREEFHSAWVDFFEANFRSNGAIVHDRDWLLTLGTRRRRP